MSIFRDVSIRGAGSDLVTYLRQDRPHNLLLWIAACMPPALIMATFYLDAREKGREPEPGIIYVESWPASRSIEDVKRDMAIRAERQAAAKEAKRQEYKALGRMFGMDVEKIERDAAAEKAAKERAEAAVKNDSSKGAAK